MELGAGFCIPRSAAGEHKESDSRMQLPVPGAEENYVGHAPNIDLSLWNDEERMKKEILAWAKTVAASVKIHSSWHLQPKD